MDDSVPTAPNSEDKSLEKLDLSVRKLRSIKEEKGKTLKSTIDLILPIINEIKLVLADEIGAVFRDFANQRVEALVDKRTIANAFTSLLNASGLSIKCPKTGRPARLIARVGSAAPKGHFQIEHRGSPPHVALSSVTFPQIDLMPSEPDGRTHYKDGIYTGLG